MDNQLHCDNNYEPIKDEIIKDIFLDVTQVYNDNICNMCKINNKKDEFVSMVHKWREYGGYSKFEYPRYFCSPECVENFERDFRCNHCHITSYEWNEYKKGPDGLTYCNDEREITIGDIPCYKICFPDNNQIDNNQIDNN